MKKILFSLMFWLISLTWNGILTIIGLIATPFVLISGGTPHRNGCSYIIEIGGDWGGINLGAVSFCGRYKMYSNDYYIHTRCHEFGHAMQGLIFGPFQIFVVAIPSVIRCWIFQIREAKKLPKKEYDDIWFEYTASKWGHNVINWLENKKYPYTFVRSKKAKH